MDEVPFDEFYGHCLKDCNQCDDTDWCPYYLTDDDGS